MRNTHHATRRQFLAGGLAMAASGLGPREVAGLPGAAAGAAQASSRPWPGPLGRITRPLAITMWDFSWIERRWPGAGYEDWNQALDELAARGYDAVRIDAYPHLVALDASREWEILPVWNQQDWGASALCRVRLQPALNDFIKACAARGLAVALSTWFREDRDGSRMKLTSPEALGRAWRATLDTVASAGLLDHLLFVDLCNEFPLDVWTPFAPKGLTRASAEGARWMRDSIAVVKDRHPSLAYTFSFTSEYETWRQQDVSMLDLLELHCWMTHWSDFYTRVGYKYERFESTGYENLVRNAERVYRERPAHWIAALERGIDELAEWSRAARLPLATTECWGIVDYKDWPLLDWGWVKELCEAGVRKAAATGRWAAMATSNFCGPQFVGMWRDADWHRRLTDVIHHGALPPSNTAD